MPLTLDQIKPISQWTPEDYQKAAISQGWTQSTDDETGAVNWSMADDEGSHRWRPGEDSEAIAPGDPQNYYGHQLEDAGYASTNQLPAWAAKLGLPIDQAIQQIFGQGSQLINDPTHGQLVKAGTFDPNNANGNHGWNLPDMEDHSFLSNYGGALMMLPAVGNIAAASGALGSIGGAAGAAGEAGAGATGTGGGGMGLWDTLSNWGSNLLGGGTPADAVGSDWATGIFNPTDMVGSDWASGAAGAMNAGGTGGGFSDWLTNLGKAFMPTGTGGTGGGLLANLLPTLANYGIKNHMAGNLTDAANTIMNRSDALQQPQRQGYQAQLHDLLTNPDSYQQTPYAKGQMGQIQNALTANLAKYGPSGTQFNDYAKNIQNVMGQDFFKLAETYGNLGGFQFAPMGAAAAAGPLTGAATSNAQGLAGFGNLFGGNYGQQTGVPKPGSTNPFADFATAMSGTNKASM